MPETYKLMLSGHALAGPRGAYNNIQKHSSVTKLQKMYDKHMNNELAGYFPIESLIITRNERANFGQ